MSFTAKTGSWDIFKNAPMTGTVIVLDDLATISPSKGRTGSWATGIKMTQLSGPLQDLLVD